MQKHSTEESAEILRLTDFLFTGVSSQHPRKHGWKSLPTPPAPLLALLRALLASLPLLLIEPLLQLEQLAFPPEFLLNKF